MPAKERTGSIAGEAPHLAILGSGEARKRVSEHGKTCLNTHTLYRQMSKISRQGNFSKIENNSQRLGSYF
jgi:hypothetical protein